MMIGCWCEVCGHQLSSACDYSLHIKCCKQKLQTFSFNYYIPQTFHNDDNAFQTSNNDLYNPEGDNESIIINLFCLPLTVDTLREFNVNFSADIPEILVLK